MQSPLPGSRRSFLQAAMAAAGAGLSATATAVAAAPKASGQARPTQIVHNSWPQVEAYLKESDGIIIPIGSTEQHGPNGPIGTDAICVEIVARAAGQRVGALVAPTLTIGMAQHHLGFPGTIALQPTTLIAVISDVVRSLAVQGFRHFHFLNGHGGNVVIIQSAFQQIHAESSLHGGATDGLKFRLDNWYMGTRALALSKTLFGARDGAHAKPSEISLAWHAWPELAQPGQRFDPEIAPRPSGPFGDAPDFRAEFPDGRIGADPSLATVAAGAQLFDASVEDMIESYRAFMALR